MNRLIIAGTVGKDAVLRRTQNGDPILGFSVAVDNGKDKESTWYDASIFGKRGQALENYIIKGTKLTLSGRPTVRVHEGKAYLGVMVDDIALQGGGKAQSRQESDSYGNSPAHFDLDDAVPFEAPWK